MQQGLYVHIIADAVASRKPDNTQIGLARLGAAGAIISSTEMFLFGCCEPPNIPLQNAQQVDSMTLRLTVGQPCFYNDPMVIQMQ